MCAKEIIEKMAHSVVTAMCFHVVYKNLLVSPWIRIMQKTCKGFLEKHFLHQKVFPLEARTSFLQMLEPIFSKENGE